MKEKADKSKLEHLEYKTLQIEPFLTDPGFTYKEI